MKKRVIAFDLDRTLCSDAKLGPINHTIHRLMRKYYDEGQTIVVYTARPEEDRHLVTAWLTREKVLYDALVMAKLRFDVLIDDRAVNTKEATPEKIASVLEEV